MRSAYRLSFFITFFLHGNHLSGVVSRSGEPSGAEKSFVSLASNNLRPKPSGWRVSASVVTAHGTDDYYAHLPRLWNKAGYTATLVACGWAGAVLEITRASGQEP